MLGKTKKELEAGVTRQVGREQQWRLARLAGGRRETGLSEEWAP